MRRPAPSGTKRGSASGSGASLIEDGAVRLGRPMRRLRLRDRRRPPRGQPLYVARRLRDSAQESLRARRRRVPQPFRGDVADRDLDLRTDQCERQRVDDGGREAQDRAADRAAACDEFQGEVRTDDLQSGDGFQGVEFLGGLPTVGEVAGRAVGPGQGGDRLQVLLLVDDARLDQGCADQVRAPGEQRRTEAGTGPGKGVGGDRDVGRASTGIAVNTSTVRVLDGVKRRRAVAVTGARTRSRAPEVPRRCQRTSLSPRASWATNSIVAVPSSTTVRRRARTIVRSSCT